MLPLDCVAPSFSLRWKKKQKDHRLGSNLAKNDSIPLKQIKLALRSASCFGQDSFWPLHSIIVTHSHFDFLNGVREGFAVYAIVSKAGY